ncbi:MAG TPA: peptidoglycan-binding domain-containing protein [Thermoanaerobaculia bacterium]|nr:peptidoglycan-binding domain-containing protein [Thermoanaerobaculia bacterium]
MAADTTSDSTAPVSGGGGGGNAGSGEGAGAGAGPGELSGPAWVARFPTRTDVAALEAGFQANVRRFLEALGEAGATTEITATLRPVERAYLMHFAYCIAKQHSSPQGIPAQPGVDIVWAHPTDDESRQAARQMCDGYGIDALQVPPALGSRHTQGRAIDMIIGWDGTLSIKRADGTTAAIASTPRDSTNPDLIAVGKTYGVIHFLHPAQDRVHWSTDGH